MSDSELVTHLGGHFEQLESAVRIVLPPTIPAATQAATAEDDRRREPVILALFQILDVAGEAPPLDPARDAVWLREIRRAIASSNRA